MNEHGLTKSGLLIFFCGLLLFSFVYSFQNRSVEISEGYPIPPPLSDPGPEAAILKIQIKDRKTDELVSATVSVNGGAQEPEENRYSPYSLRRSGNEHQGPMRLRKLDYYFYSDGFFTVKVPPGKCVVEVGRGYEYNRTRKIFHLEKNEVVQATISISRWIDMAARGWYAGDTHVHFERTLSNDDLLLNLTSAMGIRYAFSLSMNTGGYALGEEFESWHQINGLGEASTEQRGPYFLSSGQEYRSSSLGHVTIVLANGYVPATGRMDDVRLGPSLALIGDQARNMGGFMGLNHGGYRRLEADYIGLVGKADFLELLQLGGYRGIGLDGWYDFLNLGYRWPIVGASDFPYSRELGDCLTYVSSKKEPTVREFMGKVVNGHSFVTSGPMIFVSVNGKGPGELLTFSGEEAVSLEVNVELQSLLYPIRYLEIIWNGKVVTRHFDPKQTRILNFSETLKVTESGWVAVRAYGDSGTEAHSNPVYIYVNGKLPFDDDSCGQILARLESSIGSSDNPQILKQYRNIHAILKRFRRTRDVTGLGLPKKF